MRKQLLPRVTMLGFLLALAAVSVHAQSSDTVTATIPFAFTVGGTNLQAGKYTVKPASGALLIQNEDGKSSVMRMAGPISKNRASADTRLVFHRYGELYFLSEVWTSGEQYGRQLIKSRQEPPFEKQRRAHPSKKEEAQGGYDIVEIIGSLQ
jgi:hypothetical protein